MGRITRQPAINECQRASQSCNVQHSIPHFFELPIADRRGVIENVYGSPVLQTSITLTEVQLGVGTEVANLLAYEWSNTYQDNRAKHPHQYNNGQKRPQD